jgi:elongation factor Ts
MMECKKALVETGGDVEAAEDHLRKVYKGKMEKRADRAAGEGRIAIAIAEDGSAATMVELKAETDFTAKNDDFVATADSIARAALAGAPGVVDVTDEMNTALDHIRAATGENISSGRIQKIDGTGVDFGHYVHHDGKTGVLLVVEGELDEAMKRQICMHITAAVPRPAGVSPDDIPEEVVEKERKFRIEQAMESGKPKEIAEKMVEGGMRKFFGEVALLEQDFVMDPSKKIADLLGDAKIRTFHRWEVGEASA